MATNLLYCCLTREVYKEHSTANRFILERRCEACLSIE